MVRMAAVRFVVAVVTTSFISVTCVQTALVAGNRDKVVNSSTSTPATKDLTLFHLIFLNIMLDYLPGLELDAGKGAHVETMKRTRIGNVLCKNIISIRLFSDGDDSTVHGKLMLKVKCV